MTSFSSLRTSGGGRLSGDAFAFLKTISNDIFWGTTQAASTVLTGSIKVSASCAASSSLNETFSGAVSQSSKGLANLSESIPFSGQSVQLAQCNSSLGVSKALSAGALQSVSVLGSGRVAISAIAMAAQAQAAGGTLVAAMALNASAKEIYGGSGDLTTSGGSAIALSGPVSQVQSCSGSMQVANVLTGSTLQAGRVFGALLNAVQASGSANARVNATGSAAIALGAAGSIKQSVMEAGTLNISLAVGASVREIYSGLGDLTTASGSAIALAGSGAQVQACAGSMVVRQSITATSKGISSALGSMSQVLAPAGSVKCQLLGFGALNAGPSMSASSIQYQYARASLNAIGACLTGSSKQSSISTGSATLTQRLLASANQSTRIQASLIDGLSLFGACASTVFGAGNLTVGGAALPFVSDSRWLVSRRGRYQIFAAKRIYEVFPIKRKI